MAGKEDKGKRLAGPIVTEPTRAETVGAKIELTRDRSVDGTAEWRVELGQEEKFFLDRNGEVVIEEEQGLVEVWAGRQEVMVKKRIGEEVKAKRKGWLGSYEQKLEDDKERRVADMEGQQQEVFEFPEGREVRLKVKNNGPGNFVVTVTSGISTRGAMRYMAVGALGAVVGGGVVAGYDRTVPELSVDDVRAIRQTLVEQGMTTEEFLALKQGKWPKGLRLVRDEVEADEEPGVVVTDEAEGPKRETEEGSFENPFRDPRANEVARKLGIDAGTFFIFSPELMEKLDVFGRETKLMPIVPPSVTKWGKEMKEVSKLTGIPVNVEAGIVTIESMGLDGAGSGAGAQGLMQVMPFNFPEGTSAEKMVDPKYNLEIGSKYFMQVAWPQAREVFPANVDPWDMRIIARAGMAYNAGRNGATLDWGTLADSPGYFQTAVYGEYLVRFGIMAQMVKGLEEMGMGRAEIVEALVSPEVDARAWVLAKVFEVMSPKGEWSYRQYESLARILERREFRGETMGGFDLWTIYEDYKAEPKWEMPLNPAIRLYFAMGGNGLFSLSPENFDVNEWLK